MRAGASDFLVRPVAPERLLEALAANADRRRGCRRARARFRETRSAARARAAGRRGARIPRRARRRRQVGAQPPAGADRRRARHRQGNHRPRDPRREPSRQGPAADARLQGGRREHHRQRTVRPRKGRLPRRLHRQDRQDGPGRRRHIGPRRDRRCCPPKPRSCSTASSRPAKSGRSASTAAIRSTSGSSRRAAARCPTISMPALPSGSARPPSPCRRFATAAATSPRWPATCCSGSPEQTGLRPLSIGNDALAVLMRYGWPGNVRQLAGVLFRAALQCDDNSLTAAAFPAYRDPVALHGAPDRFCADDERGAQRAGARRRAGRDALQRATAICARSRRSKPTSSASRSAIIAAA